MASHMCEVEPQSNPKRLVQRVFAACASTGIFKVSHWAVCCKQQMEGVCGSLAPSERQKSSLKFHSEKDTTTHMLMRQLYICISREDRSTYTYTYNELQHRGTALLSDAIFNVESNIRMTESHLQAHDATWVSSVLSASLR